MNRRSFLAGLAATAAATQLPTALEAEDEALAELRRQTDRYCATIERINREILAFRRELNFGTCINCRSIPGHNKTKRPRD